MGFAQDCKKWNLKDIIRDMTKELLNVKSVYLFGSRGYKTNSYRSDIDLLVEFDGAPPMAKLLAFQTKYPPIDVFMNMVNTAISSANGSAIILREGQHKTLFEQLDAIKLWDSQKGFAQENSEYFVQETIANAEFPPSLFVDTKSVDVIRKVLKEPQVTSSQKHYLREAISCYYHECYLGFISMMGTFYEDLLFCLADKYSARVQAKYSDLFDDYESHVLSPKVSSKNRLESLYNFIESNDKNYFTSNGLSSNIDLYAAFDIIRKYRNEVDHPDPISETFDKSFCDLQINTFERYVPSIYKAIRLL